MGRSTSERIAEVIVAAMQEQRVSEVGLSEATGIPRVTLRRRLKGVGKGLNVDELERVCAHLGLSPADLLAGAAA